MTKSSSRQIVFGGEPISFSIDRTDRRKTVAISIGYGDIRVLAPRDMPDRAVEAVVYAKGPWILRKQASFAELGSHPAPREFVSGESFKYLGRPYRLKVMRHSSKSATTVAARGSTLVATVPSGLTAGPQADAVREGLVSWYRAKATHHAIARADVLALRLGVERPHVLIVNQSKRWGSCDAKGTVRLNWRVVMAPMTLVDYVIAHELCHLLERNHSRRFWRTMEILMPDFESRARELDRLGPSLIW
jgi:predicted metal-dependent hydrolase